MIRLIVLLFLGIAYCQTSEEPSTDKQSRQRRFAGGLRTTVAKHPSVVEIKYYDEHICSGTILDSKTILTTASCVVGKWPERMKVTLNRVEGLNSDESTKVHKVAKMDYHGSFSPVPIRRYYDAALLRLDDEIEFTSIVGPINLLRMTEATRKDKVMSTFGRCIYSNDTAVAKFLFSVSSKSISHEDCESSYKKLNVPMSSSSQICTIPLDYAPCQLDNGGPLIVDGQQVGILVWHPSCEHLPSFHRKSCYNVPSKYTDIDAVFNWIQEARSELSKPETSVVTYHPVSTEDLVYSRAHEGQAVDVKNAPFIAAIVSNTGELMCVGSIVGPAHILTDTRCVNLPLDKLQVRVGPIEKVYGEVKHRIVDRFWHPSFHFERSSRTVDDVGLLQVDPPFNFTDYVNKIELFTSRSSVVPGKTAIVYGWDPISDSLHSEDGLLTEGLQSQEFSIRHNDECNWIYSEQGGLPKGQFCASSWYGTCLGESGGGNPLVIDNDLAGIFIWNFNHCGDNRFPGVFTEIGVYHNWITSVLSDYEKKQDRKRVNTTVKTSTSTERQEPLTLTCDKKNKASKNCDEVKIVDARPTALRELR